MHDQGHQEIIIIKRGNEEEEGHHGGAWKIAFADFMTAMMALFLVLWLINAANEETKRAVASYFNPIKLVDRNRSAKGVDEQKGGAAVIDVTGSSGHPDPDETGESSSVKPQDLPAATQSGSGETNTDETFFADPMAALDQIEASVLEKNGTTDNTETKGDDAKPGKFTDPFNSGDWQEKSEPGQSKRQSAVNGGFGTQKTEPVPASAPMETTAGKVSESDNPVVAELENVVHQEIAKNLGKDTLVKDSIKIKQTDTGILIQITDLPASPMFDIGNAVPHGETVVAINAVAKALKQMPGKIHVHGHTDGRKFGSVANGNWQLSMNRAQSVYFILLRAGLADTRFSEITGFADRKPVVSADPLADQNRRIEIFLEET